MLFAQDGKYGLGASNAGLAGSSVAVANPWSIFNNVGALGSQHETAAFVAYQNRFNQSEFQTVGGGFIHDTQLATIGAAFYRFGGELYNEQRATLIIANRFQMVSLGIGVNMLQHHVAELETRSRVAIEFGGIVDLLPQLTLGAHIFNLRENIIVPTVMKAGLSYRPSDELMINVETEKSLNFKESFKFGLQYQVIKSLCLRTGLATAPFSGAFGFGLLLSQFDFDYAYTTNPNLGAIHDVSLTFRIQK